MTKLSLIITPFTLATLASAGFLDVQQERIVTMPMHRFSEDCGKKSSIPVVPGAAAMLQYGNVPGAGIDKFKAFEKVLKDGYMMVECVKDYMYYYGDKFGDNKHDYKLGPVSQVSIVHYDKVVAKKNREEMTPAVCFRFCRTVPNMGFFGLMNGRSCYCTPYYNAMESDKSQCDSRCTGNDALTCGGKSKSSVFAMHMCDSTEDDLAERKDKVEDLQYDLDYKLDSARHTLEAFQNSAEASQRVFGAVGDSGAAGLCQQAKAQTGKLDEVKKEGEATKELLSEVMTQTGEIMEKGFETAEAVTAAEKQMIALEEAAAKTEEIIDKIDEVRMPMSFDENNPTDSGELPQYKNVMYFVDKKFDGVPVTCSGDMVGPAIIGGTANSCAMACDYNIHGCVGFQIMHDLDSEETLCFLFSNFKTGVYYPRCKKEIKLPESQKTCLDKACSDTKDTGCFAKLSKFQGTTLKPDPKGKCEQCFKTLKQAERCHKCALLSNFRPKGICTKKHDKK